MPAKPYTALCSAIIIADGLPCGFHFGGEVGIHAVQLGEGEGGNLYIPSLLFIGIQTEDTLFLQCFAKDNQCCDIRQRIAC